MYWLQYSVLHSSFICVAVYIPPHSPPSFTHNEPIPFSMVTFWIIENGTDMVFYCLWCSHVHVYCVWHVSYMHTAYIVILYSYWDSRLSGFHSWNLPLRACLCSISLLPIYNTWACDGRGNILENVESLRAFRNVYTRTPSMFLHNAYVQNEGTNKNDSRQYRLV